MKATNGKTTRAHPSEDRQFLVGLARAFAGALLFGLPMLMTMEMWWIGFYANPWKLALLLLLMVPLLTGLSYVGGFESTETLRDDAVDAFVAIAVATIMAVVILLIFGVIGPDMSSREILGKVLLQTFAGSVGAVLAEGQMAGAGDEEDTRQSRRRREPSYGQELFLMVAGALFLALNVAPTEEIVLVSYMMGPWQQLGLLVLSLLIMHAFVYSVEFAGKPRHHPDATFLSLFFRFTIVGYAIVLLVSLYLLWTFDRTLGMGPEALLSACIVLGFPGAIGAAAARLIL
ncbi:TIGR02587 family membrane protein [Microvirga pudoricolor]|uniref:TIGR02587 family membrane protein n=1 Tax=Microvirga pudoricolor TaxID=2778729 RepID=UPI00194ED56F|nr:TIGR02587 family membrane protein [Microvirga pudoricolor]MBM6595989.1 TIGR02587 family membrane protein [Microvirga pudoricolor]